VRVSYIFLYLLACQARLRDESPKRWQEIFLDRELQDARMRTDNRSDAVGSHANLQCQGLGFGDQGTDNRSDAVGSKDFVYIFDEEGYGLESE